jgi:hypothetical protein
MSQKIDLNKMLEEIKSEAVITEDNKTHLSQSDIRLMRKRKKPATDKSARPPESTNPKGSETQTENP